MTTEELFALPTNDRIDRRLIRGHLVERPYPFRSPEHAARIVNLSCVFGNWRRTLDGQGWSVYGYGCPYRLHRNPDTLVCFDLAVIREGSVTSKDWRTSFVDGIPTFAAEVVDLEDSSESVAELRDAVFEAGIPLLWLIDPFNDLIDEFRPHEHVRTYIRGDKIDISSLLPGLQCFANDITDE